MKNKTTISNIILFFLIALSWSCGIWILLNPSVQKNLGFNLNPMWAWLGLMGPGLSAIVVSIKEHQLAQLFKPFFKWRVPIIYYLFVSLGVLIFYLIAAWVSILVYGNEQIQSFSWLLENTKAPFFDLRGMWVIIEITLIYAFCEELGWRGYALPKINNYLSGLSAALVIGFFWTLWHIPLVYLYGASLSFDSAIIYFIHIECMSIFYAWLFFKTDRSLLLVALFHGTTDGIGVFFPITNSLIGQGPNLPTCNFRNFYCGIDDPLLMEKTTSGNLMIIRQAKEEDAPQLTTLLTHMNFTMALEKMKSRIRAFNTNNHQLMVADQEGFIIGVIAFGCYEHFRLAGKCCHIDTLVIHKDYQKKGIGKQLIALAEKYALEQGAITIELITANHRKKTGTHAFYESLGYIDHQRLDYSYFAKEV